MICSLPESFLTYSNEKPRLSSFILKFTQPFWVTCVILVSESLFISILSKTPCSQVSCFMTVTLSPYLYFYILQLVFYTVLKLFSSSHLPHSFTSYRKYCEWKYKSKEIIISNIAEPKNAFYLNHLSTCVCDFLQLFHLFFLIFVV